MEKRLKREMRPFLTKYNLRDLSKKNLCSLSSSQREEAYKHLNTLTASNNGKLVTIENVVPKYFLPNYGNSCGPDSLLFIIFFCRGSYFLDRMFKSPLPKFDTDRELRKDLEPQLKRLYGNMALWTKNLQFQNVFTKYLVTKYKEELECDDPKVATQLWDLFVSAFPSLEFEYGSTSKRLATYLDPEEHLVTNKTHVVYGDDKHPKNRYLIQGLENLEAVLFFVNRSHYTAAVRNGDKWYYYDDTKPAIVMLKNPEEFIFKENPQKKISLLFYVYF